MALIVALDIPDREAILRVLEDGPGDILELRATVLQEHVWRQHEGLEPERGLRANVETLIRGVKGGGRRVRYP